MSPLSSHIIGKEIKLKSRVKRGQDGNKMKCQKLDTVKKREVNKKICHNVTNYLIKISSKTKWCIHSSFMPQGYIKIVGGRLCVCVIGVNSIRHSEITV